MTRACYRDLSWSSGCLVFFRYFFKFLCVLGPPTLYTVTALRPRVGFTANSTLECTVKGLAYPQIHLYRWQWTFQEKEIVANTKYQIFTSYSLPNICEHSKGSAILQINNVSKNDFGQYKCALKLPDVILAEKDISFYDFGKLSNAHHCKLCPLRKEKFGWSWEQQSWETKVLDLTQNMNLFIK